MIGLIQRVSEACVRINGEQIATIGSGLLVLVGVERHDSPATAQRLAERLLSYRVFEDDQGRMNRSVVTVDGSLLLVPQFTLAADTASGNRPGFSHAADPDIGRRLFDMLVAAVEARHPKVATGRFGADMAVSLVNRGPVTFWLQVGTPAASAASQHPARPDGRR